MIPGLVSAVIPVYNREDFLAEAIESALGQEGVRIEVVVVDDGSTDGTPATARGFREQVVYLRQENAGPPAARNRGVNAARGEYLAFLDSDDLWPPERCRLLLERLEVCPKAGGAMGRLQYIPLEATRSARFAEARRGAEPVFGYNLGACLFRAETFRGVGGFDATMTQADDWDWFVRARERGVRIERIEQVTLINRRHAGNLSNLREEGNHYALLMLKKALERRRAGGKAR
jgi:glycosyltransferase involved in cell wall biosynthesis